MRHGLGLTQGQWIHLATSEVTNLVTSRIMGSVECMHLVRQRAVPADETDRHGEKLDDGWPESVEEQGLLLLVL